MDSTARMETNLEILPYEINYLPKFALKKCEEECKETPERKINSIQELRYLLLSNPTTSGIYYHDDFLLQYLRRNKYRISRCFKEIQNFALLKQKESLTFERLPEQYLSLSSVAEIITLLPKRSPDGCAMILTQIGKWDPEVFPFLHLKQYVLTLFLQLLRDPMAQITGLKSIHDTQGISTRHLKYGTLQNIFLSYHALINCFPGRYNDVHIIHLSAITKIVWKIVKPILSEKMTSRIHFHSKSEELLKFFPSSIIPTKFGGKLQDSIDMSEFLRNARKERERYTIEGRPNLY
ncbi:unnamed protein product [Larinioides sclopetarius]|uniref:CRAL-TRIO domain-containing protein n=1 Tax=Larinioides sclopetarius TaxID=280406 RepID=A0AAV2BS37_9ARAC